MDAVGMGIKNAPQVGIYGEFRRRMYCSSLREWEDKLSQMKQTGDILFDEAYPDADDGGNVGPIGDTEIIRRRGYEYAYLVDMYGNLEACAFRVAPL